MVNEIRLCRHPDRQALHIAYLPKETNEATVALIIGIIKQSYKAHHMISRMTDIAFRSVCPPPSKQDNSQLIFSFQS